MINKGPSVFSTVCYPVQNIGATLSRYENSGRFKITRGTANLIGGGWGWGRSSGSRISRRGGRQLPRQLRFEKFVCQNERIWTCRGRAPAAPPLDPPLGRGVLSFDALMLRKYCMSKRKNQDPGGPAAPAWIHRCNRKLVLIILNRLIGP